MDDLPTIAIRLADEGIPVRAIARGLNISSSELWQELNEARLVGRLIDVPRADWPQNTSRRNRSPEFQRKGEQTPLSAIMKVFAVTTYQAPLVLALIQRAELSREQLFGVYTQGAKRDITAKTVDVQLCKIRKRFKKFGLAIETLWGRGWTMPAAHRERALKLVLAALEK